MAVLLAFIAGAFAFRGPATANFTAQFQADAVGIITVAALAFITFFGFSAIAASAGEIIEPRKTVPRAIAASIVTVTILYALVIMAMTNSTVPPAVVAEEGETAMGLVAEGFLGPFGRTLIVAGAVFSMVSASNASILAATGIGSLMGQRGQAPRPFTRIHPKYGTPIWSVTSVTVTIVAMIAFFIALFPAEGAPFGLNLGLTALTGFATLNLLLPLAVVNVALIVHRRKFPDIERGFRVPGVPLLPILGIIANLALIYNLPPKGVGTGVVLIALLVIAYLLWGGQPEMAELYQKVVPATPDVASGGTEKPGPPSPEPESAEAPTEKETFKVLVSIARPDRAPQYVRLAKILAQGRDKDPFIQVLNVTEIQDQTPHEMVTDTAEARARRIESTLEDQELDVAYSVEGHTSRDIAFDIVQTAREDEADLVMMGYPEERPGLTQAVEFKAPCDVIFASGFENREDPRIENVVVGAGGGPHHLGSLSTVRAMAEQGAAVQVVSVRPMGSETEEDPSETISELHGVDVDVRTVESDSISEGLVEATSEVGGILVIGASRDRRLSQWVFGSTPDRVIEAGDKFDLPVLVYATSGGIAERLEDYLFPVYRYLRRFVDSNP